MADTNAFVTIDYVVSSFLNWKGIAGVADYDRYKQILIEGFTDLNMFHTSYYRTSIGPVNDINQMPLPSDYIDWLMVAVEENGYYWELDMNDSIITEPSILAATPTYSEHLSLPDVQGFKYTTKRRNIKGSFSISQDKRAITFVGDFKGRNIYLLYSSSGVPVEGVVYVPRELSTVLRTYLDWQLKESNDMVPAGVTQRAEYIHGLALGSYYENKDQLSGKELMDIFRNGIQQGIKR